MGVYTKSRVLSIAICLLMITSISAPITQNVGQSQNHIQSGPSPTSGGSGGLADSPWPMFRQNLNHTGQSPYDTSANPGTEKWNFTTDGFVYSSPAIGHNGTIYVGSNDKNLYAIYPNGTEKWNFTTDLYVMSSPAVDSSGTIYVGSSDGKLYAINPDGTEKWNFIKGPQGSAYSSPTISNDGTIYIGSSDYKIYAINPDGTEKWSYLTDNMVTSSPAIGLDGTIYVGSKDNKLYAINLDGTKKWSFVTGGYVHSSPAISSDDTIYFGSWDGKLYAVYPNGTEKWSFSTFDKIISSPSIGLDGTIYVGSHDYRLYAINPDGTEKWNFITDEEVYSSPAIGFDGTIYVASEDGKLYAINPNGTKKWSFTTNGEINSSPAIGSDGTIYIGSNDFKFYAIGVPPSLNVNVTSHFTSLNSAAQSAITVHVTDGTNPVQGATLNLVSDNGGIFSLQSGITDSNGDFNSIFNAPTVTTQIICRISAEVSKTGYNDGSGYVDVTINPIPWPMFRHNLNHTGLSPYDTSTNPGKLKWSYMTGDFVRSSPAIGFDGTIYIGSRDNKLYAINPDGTEKWKFSTGGHVDSSPAIGSDGTIYVGSKDNNLYAIDSDGTKKWSFKTDWEVSSSPAITLDGTIYIGSHDHNLYAINPNGTEKWRFTTGANLRTSPAIGFDGTIYIGSYDFKLYAVNPDGTEKWNFTTGDLVSTSSPAIGIDGTIFIGSDDHKLYAIYPNGTEKWNFVTYDDVDSSPAIGSDGTIYVGSDDRHLYAINPDGTEKWNFPIVEKRLWYSSPAIGSDGTIYVGYDTDRLYAINPDGTEKWSYITGDGIYSSPAIGFDGTIYVGCSDGKLYAIGKTDIPPIADAGPDQSINEGDLVQFDGSASFDPDGTIEAYEWDFGDGSPQGTGVNPTRIYNTPGNYTVTLIVTDDENMTDSDTCTITVLAIIQPPNANAGSDQMVYEGDLVHFDGSCSTGSTGHKIADPSVVALWHMNNGSGNIIYDSTDYHNNGTIIGATWTSDGRFGNALSFDGINDYIEVKASDQIFGDNPDAWSFFVWFKTSNWMDKMSLISDRNDKERKLQETFGVDLYLMGRCIHNSIGALPWELRSFRCGLNYWDGSWHFIGVTISEISGDGKLYYDGEFANSFGVIPIDDYFDGDMLRIGASWALNLYRDPGTAELRYYFQGSLDEIVLFNRLLTEQEILDYYNSGTEYSIDRYNIPADIVSYEWDFDSDGIYDYQETIENAPDGAFDGKTTHIYGDNGGYIATLRITDEFGYSDTDICNILVKNVNPVILSINPITVDENSPFVLTATAMDAGSDDLTFTWDWGYGAIETSSTFFNNGISKDPYQSPWGIYPFSITDTMSHIYGDDGVFPVTLTVKDDDGGSSVYIVNVEVLNVDPTVMIESITLDVEIGLRVAGRKYNNVSMVLYEDGSQLGYVSIERLPGSPDEQMAWIPISINFSSSYNATVTYTPDDPPNVGGNPVWLYIQSQNGSIKKIHHTFNVQQSKKRDSEHWNHVEPWEVDLNAHFIGLPFEIISHITDSGSDDETLTYTYGSQVKIVTFLNNPPNPDPYPSPEVNPVDIFDTTTLVYEGPGTVTVVVKDDDNIRLGVGEGIDSFSVA